MSRERFAKVSTSSNLQWDANNTNDIDIIAAFGVMAGRGRALHLGRLLLQLRGYAEVQSKTDLQKMMGRDRAHALLLTMEILREKFIKAELTGRQSHRLCDVGIEEWIFDRCRQCHGAGSIKREQGGTLTCDVCNGTGKHRYSDQERAQAIGVAPERLLHYERMLATVIDLCNTCERLAVGATNEMLERW